MKKDKTPFTKTQSFFITLNSVAVLQRIVIKLNLNSHCYNNSFTLEKFFAADILWRTVEITNLNKYVTKTLQNDCFIDLEVRKL